MNNKKMWRFGTRCIKNAGTPCTTTYHACMRQRHIFSELWTFPRQRKVSKSSTLSAGNAYYIPKRHIIDACWSGNWWSYCNSYNLLLFTHPFIHPSGPRLIFIRHPVPQFCLMSRRWNMFNVYIENVPPNLCPYLCQILISFLNSFTVTLRGQFAIKLP